MGNDTPWTYTDRIASNALRGAAAADVTVIPCDVSIRGEISRKDDKPIVIAGEVVGRVQSRGAVLIERGGSVDGNIECDTLIVAGQAGGAGEGHCEFICKSLHVTETGDLGGANLDVVYETIRVDQGARIQASLSSLSDRQSKAASASPVMDVAQPRQDPVAPASMPSPASAAAPASEMDGGAFRPTLVRSNDKPDPLAADIPASLAELSASMSGDDRAYSGI